MKNKIVISIFILAFLAGIFMLYKMKSAPKGKYLKVEIDGELYKIYDISSEEVVDLGSNQFEIKGGMVKMIKADCPDKICIEQGAISRKGESIVCLPNKTVLSILDDEDGIDAAAR